MDTTSSNSSSQPQTESETEPQAAQQDVEMQTETAEQPNNEQQQQQQPLSTPILSTSTTTTDDTALSPTSDSHHQAKKNAYPNIRVIKPPRTDGPSSYLPPPPPESSSSPSNTPGSVSPVPTASELKNAFAGTLSGRHGPNAPLMTKAMRDKEDARLGRVKKEWDVVKIRFKFSDRTQLETIFHTSSNLSNLYSFLPTTFSQTHQSSKFTLYQTPPKKDLLPNDLKIKDKNLGELGMVPQAIIYVRFQDSSLNESGLKPPLKEDLWEIAEECEPPRGLDERKNGGSLAGGRTLGGGGDGGDIKKEDSKEGKDRSSGNKTIPKWLMKGLKK